MPTMGKRFILSLQRPISGHDHFILAVNQGEAAGSGITECVGNTKNSAKRPPRLYADSWPRRIGEFDTKLAMAGVTRTLRVVAGYRSSSLFFLDPPLSCCGHSLNLVSSLDEYRQEFRLVAALTR